MNSLHEVSLADIKPDRHQPRKTFTDVDDLAANMKVEGLIHPIELDSNLTIVVGERRYLAAKQLGWETIAATIHETPLTPYERLRRQMSENLHQSAARNGESMNPMETARGWVRLYELKTGKNYSPGEQFLGGRGIVGPLAEIAEEISAKKTTVWELLKLLEEPQIIQEAISRGLPRTYIREADKAPEEHRQALKKKIIAGDYKNREDVVAAVRAIRKIPELADVELRRQQKTERAETNRILNTIASLALALEAQPFDQLAPREKTLVEKQLNWLSNRIDDYFKKEAEGGEQ